MVFYIFFYNVVKEGYIEVVSYFLWSGSYVDIIFVKGEIFLSLVVRKINNKEIVGLLFFYGSSFNLCDWYGWMFFYYVVEKEVVEFLVEKGVDFYVRDFEGKILLFLVVLDGYIKVVEFFIEKGSIINMFSGLGDIFLYEVVIRGYVNIV